MSLKHRNAAEYEADVGPRLREFIDGQRDRVFEKAVSDAFAFFAFVTEDFRAKAQANVDIYDRIGIMLVELLDAFRGLLQGQAALSPVTIAALTRVALEVRMNLEFILSQANAAVWADRYQRYAQVSKLAHDNRKAPGERRLTGAEVAEIRRLCPEWVKDRPDGTYKLNLNWTADAQFDSLRKIATQVGLSSDYENTYAATSEYVHGTYLLVNAYRGPEGIGPVGSVAKCKQMTFLGVSHCLRALRATCTFFQVPLDPLAFAQVREAMREACRELLDAPSSR